jgi:hypothetical protein
MSTLAQFRLHHRGSWQVNQGRLRHVHILRIQDSSQNTKNLSFPAWPSESESWASAGQWTRPDGKLRTVLIALIGDDPGDRAPSKKEEDL